MTKQEIYEQIVQLTAELHATNVAEQIFSAAKEGDPKKVEEVFETFKKEKPGLYQKIVEFGEKYNEIINNDWEDGEIFTIEEDKERGYFIFDANIIDSLSFFVFICFANIDNIYLFCLVDDSATNFVKAFEEAGYEEIAEFIANFSWIDWVGEDEDMYSTWYELIVAIFEGEFSDEEETE